VHQAAFEGVLQAEGSLANVVAGHGNRQRACISDQMGQVGPVDVFHDEKMEIAGLIGVVSHDNIGMGQLGNGLYLALEAFDRFRVVEVVFADQLESDQAVEFVMARLENQAHTAFAQPFEQDVGAQQQLLSLALQQLIDLIGRQPASLQELGGEGARLSKAMLEVGRDFFNLDALQQIVLR
jgi:hypothetical protein